MPRSAAYLLNDRLAIRPASPRLRLGGVLRLLVVFYMVALAFALFARPAAAQEAGSVRPTTRQEAGSARPSATQEAGSVRPAAAQEAGLAAFVEGLWPQAQARGVSRATFDAAFDGVTANPALLRETHAQTEFTRTAGDYLTGAVNAARVAEARRQAQRWGDTLADIERRTGVDRWVTLGVWGMESNFGKSMGGQNVIRSLATLAAARHRGDLFRDELIDALLILEQGHVTPRAMIGSWAGAMGQTQFMPSSFLKHAVDFDGDGRKDIWTSVPDALASTAQFLKDHGWQAGVVWGAEALLPEGFVLKAADHAAFRPFSEWSARGVVRADGSALPARGEARLTLPMGRAGPAFLRTPNFEVIRDYNTSTSYALAVSMLGDRAAGRAPSPLAWPKEKALTAAQSLDLQKSLARQGYEVAKFDGKIGDKDRAVIALWQERHGLDPDGHPTPALVARIHAGR